MQLTTDEVVDLRCDVHEWMNAYLVPAETPYFAGTDASGSFAIDEIAHQIVRYDLARFLHDIP